MLFSVSYWPDQSYPSDVNMFICDITYDVKKNI